MQGLSYNRAYPITKSDTVNILLPANAVMEAIWVGGAGIVLAIYQDDSQAQFTCVAGTILPINCKRVQSTTTTATLMVALFSV